MSIDQIGLWAGFVLTLMVFSYLLADNFLYRIAVYAFVGLAAGYVAIITVESVILPYFRGTILSGDLSRAFPGVLPLLLGVLLLVKTSSRLGRLGNLAIAFIIGVGAAVALVGAITGTLLPLATSTASSVRGNLLEGVILVVGVACSLLYFQYLARRKPDGTTERRWLGSVFSTVGQGFIVVTLGALYAAAILTSLTIFSERIVFLVTLINGG
jgi:hypothetical protein